MDDKLIHQIDDLVFAFLGILDLLLAAHSIWKLISFLNLRDDPRHAKRPPHAP